jgi:transposase
LSRIQTFIAQKYSGVIKNQIERGFRLIIEPQFFADSFFVKKLERVETILFIMFMSLCLLVYNLGQRELRKTLL